MKLPSKTAFGKRKTQQKPRFYGDKRRCDGKAGYRLEHRHPFVLGEKFDA